MSGGIALLGFGKRLLAVALNNLVSIEHTGKLIAAPQSAPGAFAGLTFAGHELPVYAFTNDFLLFDQQNYPGHFCVVLETEESDRRFGLACEQVEQLRSQKDYAGLQLMPDSMQLPRGPFAGVFMRAEKLVFMSEAASLLDYIDAVSELYG